jgi:hypothetical protein
MKQTHLVLCLNLGLWFPSLFAQNIFIVRRDVPDTPSVVVVPSSWSRNDLEYADKIEEIVIGFGLKVVQRPSTRIITETKGAVGTTGGETVNGVGTKTLKEEYVAYQETGANYLLLTDENSSRFKLILINTHELLASVKVGRYEPCGNAFSEEGESLGFSEQLQYCLYKALEGAGLPVRKRVPK